jgi:hypothetical protein
MRWGTKVPVRLTIRTLDWRPAISLSRLRPALRQERWPARWATPCTWV